MFRLACLVVAAAVFASALPAEAQSSRRQQERAAQEKAAQDKAQREKDELDAAMPKPNTCSTAFHGELASLSRSADEDFRRVKTTLRLSLPDLPPRWLAAEPRPPLDWTVYPQLAKAKGQPTAYCTELTITGDTAACKSTPKPRTTPVAATTGEASLPPPAAPTAKPRVTLDDRPQRLLEVYRRAGGVSLELREDGKYFLTVERVAQDLTNYVSQPVSAAICSGAPEMLEFVETQLAGPSRRSRIVRDTARIAGEQALRLVEALPRAEAEPASASEDAGQMTARLARIALAPEAASAIAREPTFPGRLRLALAGLRGLPPTEAASVRQALAAIEVFDFGSRLTARYALYDLAYLGTIARIRAAHTANCTCKE